MKRGMRFLHKHKNQFLVYGLIGFLILILLFLFFDLVKLVIVVTLFIGVNSLIRIYRRVFPGIPIEFEVVILGGTICTIAFGWWAGFIVAVIGAIFAEFFNQFISPFSLVNWIAYLFVPIIALFLTPASIVTGGFAIVIVVNVIIFTVSLLLGYDHFKNAAFSITNIFFNWLLFSYLAEPLLRLIMG